MAEVSLDAKQSEAFRLVQPGRKIIFALGRGVGKTFLDRMLVHSIAFTYPGTHIGLLYPTLKQSKQIIWPGLLEDYYGALKRHVAKPRLDDMSCVYRNGSRVTTWGAENINAMRGQRFGALVEDEADDIDPDAEAAVVEPTFSKSGGKAIWIKSGTPRRGRQGGLYQDFARAQEQAASGYANLPRGALRHYALRVRSCDSPQVDRDWLEGVKQDLIAAGRGAIYAREYDCDFDAAEGLVYSVFDVGFHLRAPRPAQTWSEILIGVDHGWEDPAVFLVAGVQGSGADAVVHVLEEFYERHKTPTEIRAVAKKLKAKYSRYRQTWFADPSQPAAIEEFRRDGLHIEGAQNDIEVGIGAVSDRLAIQVKDSNPDDKNAPVVQTARLYIDPSCVNTIWEMGRYRRKRDPRNPERVLDEPVDRDNHAMDALRYLVFSRFGGQERKRVVRAGFTYG